jgi:tetratricopeptide (TPR) repeat protein
MMRITSAESGRARTRLVTTLLLLLFLAAPGLLAGCGKEKKGPTQVEGPPQPPAAAVALTDSGWGKFEAGDYAGAVTDFTSALAVDGASDYIDALSGRGWSRLRMNDYPTALTDFASAVDSADKWQITIATVNARAGQGITASRVGDYAVAVEAASYAVDMGGEFYAFSHDPSIGIDTLRLLLAESLVRLQRYDDAYDVMVEIDVTVLERIDPRSETFVEELVLELERMGAEF